MGEGCLEVSQVFQALFNGLRFFFREFFFFVESQGDEVSEYIDDEFVDAAEPAAADDGFQPFVERSGDFYGYFIFFFGHGGILYGFF